MFNRLHVYNHNIALAAGAIATYQHKMQEDFYCFDIAGVDSVATGVNLRIRIRNITEERELMPERMRSGLIAAMVSGDSSWYFPTLFKKGDVIEIEAALDAGSPAVDLDIGLIGYHHPGGNPDYCESPKSLYWYSWDFDTVNAGAIDIETQRILINKDFVGVGWVSTDNCTTVNSLYFNVKNETLGYNWFNIPVMGSVLFPGINFTVRRNRFRIPILLRAGSVITMECHNTTVGNVLDVAVGMYGYHLPPAVSL